MLVILSPAKALDMDTPPPIREATQPRLLQEAQELIAILRTKSPEALQSLMGISPKLAALNSDRHRVFSPPFTPENAMPAAYAFNGDVYDGLDARTMDAEAMAFAQDHLRIISGLFGLLRPLDLMQAYRLSMGAKLKTPRGKDLYAFWGDRISMLLQQDAAFAKTDTLINLASKEYFSVINPAMFKGRVITPVFKDQRKGVYKIIGLLAKKARGAMARYIIDHRLNEPEGIKEFTGGGYRFAPDASDADTWVFLRKESG